MAELTSNARDVHQGTESAFQVSNENCAVCGCTIALLPKKGAKPVRHANKVYCSECARLILDPDTDRGAEEIDVPDPDFAALEKVASITPVSISSVRRATGIKVVEEFSIKAVGPNSQQRERKLEDDDWFKAGNKAADSNAAVAEKKKGTAILPKRSEPEKKSISNRSTGVKPSGRMPAAKPSGVVKSAPRTAQPETEAAAPSRKPSRRMERPGVRPSGRLGKPSRAKMTPASEAPPEDPALIAEEQVAAPVESPEPTELAPDAPRKGDSSRSLSTGSRKSSRTMKPAKRGGNAKSNRSDRSDRSDREESRGRGAKGGRAGGNNNMMIGLGVAGVVLLLVCIGAMVGGGKPADAKKATVVNETLHNASDYADKAQRLLASGDREGAATYYTQAAEAAEATGNQEAAQRYSMRAYDLRKFTKLNMSHQ